MNGRKETGAIRRAWAR